MTETGKRISVIIDNFENDVCIFGCGCKVETNFDLLSFRTYKCPICKKEYTAKSVFKAIKIIRER